MIFINLVKGGKQYFSSISSGLHSTLITNLNLNFFFKENLKFVMDYVGFGTQNLNEFFEIINEVPGSLIESKTSF